MKRTMLFPISLILLFFFLVPVSSQELVVFNNDTALSVRKHSEKDGFVYLTLNEGEIAVPKSRVREIRKEAEIKADNSSGSVVSVQTYKVDKSRGPIAVNEGNRGGFRGGSGFSRPKPPETGVMPNAAGDDEDDDDESSDDGDDDDGGDDGADNQPPPQNPVPQLPTKIGGRQPSPMIKKH